MKPYISPSEAADTANKVVEIAESISKALDKVHVLKKEGHGIYIKVPEKVCQYDVIIRCQRHGIVSKKINLPLPGVDQVMGTCMPSLFSLHNAIVKTQDGFTLSIETIPEGTDYILMQFQYKIPNPNFVMNLVESSVSVEPVEYNDRDEYWMHAQLKFPQVLHKAYSHLRLQDVDLDIDVAIDNEVKTAIPKSVTWELRKIRKLLGQTDRNLMHAAFVEYMRSKRRVGFDVYSLVNEIGSLFLPDHFRKFVDISPPFKYFNSKQGTDFYDSPGQAFPKSMTVVSRTDLSLETPAKEGKLVYKKQDLLSELEKIFE